MMVGNLFQPFPQSLYPPLDEKNAVQKYLYFRIDPLTLFTLPRTGPFKRLSTSTQIIENICLKIGRC
jgi:hypothetical protein